MVLQRQIDVYDLQIRRPKCLVVFGSSNGEGVGASTHVKPSAENKWGSGATTWAGLLAASLGNEWVVYNRSVSGYSNSQQANRFWTDVAPHAPSHVILCTGVPNDAYNADLILRGVIDQVRMCRQINAVPVVRGVYPHDAMTAAQYASMLAVNRQLQMLGCPYIDHMSTVDDGNGHYIGGTTYAPDGLHPNDAGYAIMFNAIDLGIFRSASLAPSRPTLGSWKMNGRSAAASGIDITVANGLTENVKSFTMMLRLKGAGSSTMIANAIMCAFIYNNSSAVRFRCVGIAPYDVADGTGALVATTIDPTADTAKHHFAMTYNAVENLLRLYADGVLVGSSATVTFASVFDTSVKKFSFGCNPYSGSAQAAQGFIFSDVSLYNVPLSAGDIADCYLNSSRPNGGLLFAADLSSRPANAGRVPNFANNGLLPLANTDWVSVPNT